MVFDRRFTTASTRYLGFGGSNEYRQRRALPVAHGFLCALDLVLLNGVRWRLEIFSPGKSPPDLSTKTFFISYR